MIEALGVVQDVLASVPDPGGAEAPPGMGGFTTILKWALWAVFGICVRGLMIAGGMMAIGSRRGEAGEHVGKVGWALAGVIVAGAAAGLVQALV
jgi:hypothetical protein